MFLVTNQYSSLRNKKRQNIVAQYDDVIVIWHRYQKSFIKVIFATLKADLFLLHNCSLGKSAISWLDWAVSQLRNESENCDLLHVMSRIVIFSFFPFHYHFVERSTVPWPDAESKASNVLVFPQCLAISFAGFSDLTLVALKWTFQRNDLVCRKLIKTWYKRENPVDYRKYFIGHKILFSR